MATFLGKNKHINKESESKFKPNKKIGKFMWIDSVNSLMAIAVKDRMKPNYIVETSRVKSYAIWSNEKEIKGKSGLGRSVGGGLLFGSTGAIVGAVTGKKDSKSIINNLQLIIDLEYDEKIEKETIPLILMRKVDVNSNEYKSIESNLSEMVKFLDYLLESNADDINNYSFDFKQQLIDLKGLLDLNVITQEEFDKKKLEILRR